MLTFTNALAIAKEGGVRGGGVPPPARGTYGVSACERVMQVLVKFLDEVDRPHVAYGGSSSHMAQLTDEGYLKVCCLC